MLFLLLRLALQVFQEGFDVLHAVKQHAFLKIGGVHAGGIDVQLLYQYLFLRSHPGAVDAQLGTVELYKIVLWAVGGGGCQVRTAPLVLNS